METLRSHPCLVRQWQILKGPLTTQTHNAVQEYIHTLTHTETEDYIPTDTEMEDYIPTQKIRTHTLTHTLAPMLTHR